MLAIHQSGKSKEQAQHIDSRPRSRSRCIVFFIIVGLIEI